MDGSADPYAEERKHRQETMWPSASAVALRGRDWYRDGPPDRLREDE